LHPYKLLLVTLCTTCYFLNKQQRLPEALYFCLTLWGVQANCENQCLWT